MRFSFFERWGMVSTGRSRIAGEVAPSPLPLAPLANRKVLEFWAF
jgi:hypothetical protein